MQQDLSHPGDLREYLAVLRRRRWSILLVTALTLASALFFSFRQTPVYRSETQVLVRSVTTVATQVAPTINMENERARASSFPVAQLVREQAEVSEGPEALLEDLDVSVEPTSDILVIGYTDPDPTRAQLLASSFAESYLAFRRQAAETELQSQRGALETESGTLGKQVTALDRRIAAAEDPGNADRLAAQREEVLARQLTVIQTIQSLRSELRTLSQSGEVTQPADLPSTPAAPSHVRNGLLALVVGLALGVGLAFLRERLDDRLTGRADLEHLIGAPVMAVVPAVPGWRKREETRTPTLSDPASPPSEAYRTLRTNVEYLSRDGAGRVLVVSSPSDGEGKTTTAANLAVSLGRAGKRVIAVSCDLRRPRLHSFFNMSNGAGVTTVLAGRTSLSEAARRASMDALRVLPSGPVPPNPAELLGSEEMERLLADLRRQADYVLLDSPPVLAVSDALILATRSDGVLLVVDAITTTRAAAAHARELLEQVGARVVGGVLNNFDPDRARGYPSYYTAYYSRRYQIEGNGGTAGEAAPRPASGSDEMWH